MNITEVVTKIDEHYGKYRPWYKFVVFPILWLLSLYFIGAFSVWVVAEFLRLIG